MTRRAVGRSSIVRAVRLRPARRRAALDRLGVLLRALDDAVVPAGTLEGRLAQAADLLRDHRAEEVWLALAVLTARLPEVEAVTRVRRLSHLDGPERALAEILDLVPDATLDTRVEVARGEVVVDVNHLSRTTLTTGIQRVTQRTVSRWMRDHEVSLVCWTDENRALRRTRPAETARVAGTPAPASHHHRDHEGRHDRTVVVPWRSTYVLPEVALEVERTSRLRALALHSRCTTAAIGFDTVPLTSAETTDVNVPGYFMRELAAIRHMDRVACISEAARTEYAGWRTMLGAIGVPGPRLAAVSLPVEAPEPTEEQIEAARDRYTLPGAPMVLCVGSHEPRKNHIAVLQAAELLWRKGHTFTLLFVGGNAWRSDRFHRWLEHLRAQGRSVEAALQVPDSMLWALYRVARCTVFPSLNEGFGLPVAESLAIGTPAVTSDFGSMREIAAPGGALMVDPRDDHAIADALEALLTDDLLHGRLVREAAARPARTWDDYAAETWAAMVEGTSDWR